MGCCTPEGKEPDNVVDRFKSGAKTKRTCTDLFFLFLFIGFGVFMIGVIAGTTSKNGNPYKLIKGVDYKGDICGHATAEMDRPYTAWPSYYDYDVKYCVASCDETANPTGPMKYPYTATELFGYCLPLDQIKSGAANFASFSSVGATAARAISDLWTTAPVIAVAPLIAFVLAFFYMTVARSCSGVLVKFMLLLLLGAGVLSSVTLLNYAYSIDEAVDADRAEACKWIGFGIVGATLLFLAFLIYMRKRIEVGIEVVEQAAAANDDIKSLFCFPLVPFVMGCLVFVYWIIGCLFIFSVTTSTMKALPADLASDSVFSRMTPAVTEYAEQNWNRELQGVFALQLFHLFWAVEFCIFFAYLVVAGVIAQWYFARASVADGSPVTESCQRTCRFHLGSVALGALIIAIVQFVRFVVKYIESKVKSKNPNRVQRCVWCLINCCLRCVQCLLERVSANAFAWMAIWGHSFCSSAASSTSLIMANLGRVAAINMVGALVLFVGKFTVSLLTAGISGAIMASVYNDTTLHSLALPCFAVFVVAYLVSCLFMGIFDTSIDVMFLCFLVDEHNNQTHGTPRIADSELMELVDKHKNDSLAIAHERREAENLQLGEGQYDEMK